MPANQLDGPADWSPKSDFVRTGWQPYRVAPAEPETREQIRDYLVDIGASALAAANQFVDPAVADEIYEDMAMRVHEDVEGGYYPLDIAILRQQYRELGLRRFRFTQLADGGEEGFLAS
jgi:hypothetical protein